MVTRNKPHDPTPMLESLSALGAASQTAALLRGALRTGFLLQCVEPTAVAELSTATGLDPDRVDALCSALRVAGALSQDDLGRYVLSPLYAALFEGGLEHHVAAGLNGVAVRQAQIERLFSPTPPDWYWTADPDTRAALAASTTVEPSTALARRAMTATIEGIAEWGDAFAAGGRFLELGCGVAGALLTYLQLYPDVTAVGVELAPDLVDIARARARLLGVADRVEFVVGDAATYQDGGQFDVAFWSQFFFPRSSRSGALANIHRRLRPGGLLIAPVLIREPASDDVGAALDALLVRSWDVPVLTAEDVQAEIEDAGFVRASTHPGSFITVVLAHQP